MIVMWVQWDPCSNLEWFCKESVSQFTQTLQSTRVRPAVSEGEGRELLGEGKERECHTRGLEGCRFDNTS